MNTHQQAVIVSATRTPIGSFGGALASMDAISLGTCVAKSALERAKLSPETVDEAVFGNVLSAGLGQNPARQIAIHSGIPAERPAMTVNMVCASGMKAIALAAQSVSCGESRVVLCGGTESMSRAPYLMPSMRWGARMGNAEALDHLVHDGLRDAFHDCHMGETAENVAELHAVSRAEQDAFALESQQRASLAQKDGLFSEEITAVEVPGKRGKTTLVVDDEFIRHDAHQEAMARLKPAFRNPGTVTPANASGINDGAAALVVASASFAAELGIRPLARIVTCASAGIDPRIMGCGPVPATRLALERAGWTVDDLDLVEANEAFAAQAIAVQRELGLDPAKLNIHGGAIALGHPIGASGARIVVTLAYAMQRRGARRGLATLCVGGGMGCAILLERDAD